MTRKISSAIGAGLFVVLACLRLAHPNALAVLLAAESALAAYLLIFRRKAHSTSPVWVQIISWASAFLPLAMDTSSMPPWVIYLSMPGLILVILSQVSIRSSFSISPADRGLVFSGPYRRIRHPMYAGELASLLPIVLLNSSFWNVFVGLIFFCSIMWRIRQEETLLKNYELYSQFVQWKMLPGVW